MKKRTANEIRQLFLQFFEEKKHTIEPSVSLVPHDDPSLLWINSGVATLKKYFDGRVIPDNPRIANVQKSIRTNDIENVGKTARHHTFFEMLGNFSIGDYFKREAIVWAWEFLTSEEWLGFAAEKLFITIHPDDDEAFEIWNKEIGVPKEHIIRLEENFWDIGEGPSGPNTEIFFDRGEEYGDDPNDPELYPGGENERYLEIWNLVFSQFNHNPDGTYTPLPKKNIDTGMGLERMASVIQNVSTNFDTDLFIPIIRATEQLAHIPYLENEASDEAYKVIADHIRTCTFAIGDGALPTNEGRGYVLRRLLRRAVRYAKTLHIHEPFMYKLVPIVADTMKDAYPEVMEKKQFIQKVIHTEEERFHETLNDGLAMLSSIVKGLKSENKTVISGEDVFRLYDTYGFPYELTQEYAEDENLTIDVAGFEQEMAKQRERARSARQATGSMQVQSDIYTDMSAESVFVGYENLTSDAIIETMIARNELITEATAGQEVQVILSETPFYAESGGQIADEGKLLSDTMTAVVTDVQKAPTGQHLHTVRIEEGKLVKDEQVRADVNRENRIEIVKNHTATHLLHQALKDVLGSHIEQKGSLVAADRLRFDFSHFNQITDEELTQIETIVNEKVWANLPLMIMEKELEEAKQMGAMALFGEKYGDIVRVVQIGDYSLELCGGCHVNNTAEIGLFKIIAESGIGAGIRRIEAVTGKSAYDYMNEHFHRLDEIAERLNTTVDDVEKRVDTLQKQIRELQKENESLGSKLGHLEAKNLTSDLKEVNGVHVIARKVTANDMGALRKIVDELKTSIKSGVILLATVHNERVSLAAGVTEDLIKRGFHAGKLIKVVSERVGGGGGGRPDMAQAGGKNPEKLDEALKLVEDWVKSIP